WRLPTAKGASYRRTRGHGGRVRPVLARGHARSVPRLPGAAGGVPRVPAPGVRRVGADALRRRVAGARGPGALLDRGGPRLRAAAAAAAQRRTARAPSAPSGAELRHGRPAPPHTA